MNNVVVDSDVKDEQKDSETGKWRNLYLRLHSGVLVSGSFLWPTKEEAEWQAHLRKYKELTEYLGAFQEI